MEKGGKWQIVKESNYNFRRGAKSPYIWQIILDTEGILQYLKPLLVPLTNF